MIALLLLVVLSQAAQCIYHAHFRMSNIARLHSPEYDYEPIIDAPMCNLMGKEYCLLADRYVKTVMRSVCGYLLLTPDFSFAHVKESTLKPRPFSFEGRLTGQGRPQFGLTMVGYYRLKNIHQELVRVMKEGVEGDFMEAGVWRGGSCIVAKAVLNAYDSESRKVHVVDSFQGLPPPRKNFQTKEQDRYSMLDHIRVSQEAVSSNFERYNLLDDNVLFHKGFFNVSLSQFRKDNPNAKIAVLRMDGDMYESTTDILYNVYDFVQVGGSVIIDDWMLGPCKQAFYDFFQHHGIKEEMISIAGQTNGAVYFRKTQSVKVDYQYYIDNFYG